MLGDVEKNPGQERDGDERKDSGPEEIAGDECIACCIPRNKDCNTVNE